MTLSRRAFTLALAVLAAPLLARAQDFPTKSIKIIYTYAPGGPGDSLTRTFAEALGGVLGQPVVVENRTGANGAIGIIAAAHSAPDGYTLVLTTITTTVLAPLVTKDASLEPAKALAPILNVSVTPLVLLAHPSVPANDFPGFVEWANKQPGGIDVGVAGPTLEVSNALLAKDAKIKVINVFYRGGGPALQALLAGEVKVFFNPPSGSMLEFIRQGKVKVLGVTSAEPSPLIPGGVPISKFLPGYIQDINFALWAPAGTPRDVMAKLEAASRKALATPGMADKLANMGTTLNVAGPDEVTRITKRETQNFKTAMESASIKFGE
ncbi:MAG: hypothetical protein JWQ73_3786 [Variovorax sp.]|jgi:tripartite-type tricarboxylate transporter receptor subunit TctC|nr:hypothetical protein [Variovorax sp.]